MNYSQDQIDGLIANATAPLRAEIVTLESALADERIEKAKLVLQVGVLQEIARDTCYCGITVSKGGGKCHPCKASAALVEKRNDELLQKASAALLDDKSPGWDEGTKRLLTDMGKRKDECGVPPGRCYCGGCVM